jgi:hypothetical protein
MNPLPSLEVADASRFRVPRSPWIVAKRRWRSAALALLLVCGCSRLTDVSAPDVVQESAFGNPAGAEAFRVGAISSFALVFGGAELGQITTSGAMADEFLNAASGAIALAGADQRVVPDPGTNYPYAGVQRARLDARRAIAALQQYAPTPRSRTAELFALAGYTELFLGENMCSGIPLGEIVNGDPAYGTPLPTTELFGRAVSDYDSALVYAADSVRILNLARVGRGRALLDGGRFADAAAAVTSVPTAFTYVTQHSATVQPNGVFAIINNSRWLTVADREGGNGLDFRAASDPRVRTALVGKGVDGMTDVYTFTRYASLASPLVLASGVEARLIEAEAALRGGDAAGALAILNALRVTTAGLAPLALEASEGGRVDQLFRERAFWLFATGHRHSDLRRLVRQYGRAIESVFPTGAYKAGQTYGADVTFTPDPSQLGNPNYTGCSSRAP